MKKKSFALAWGRKMFFGLGWLITTLVALTYLQSMIIPQGIEAWSFYFINLIGHIGLILSGVYFLLYCPVMTLFPSYYGARLWSVFLLLCLNALIFLDSYIFIHYRFHLNSFVIKTLNDPEVLTMIGLTPIKLGLIGMLAFIITVLYWLRGDNLWQTMQARFSNPVKNWYLVLIVFCFLAAQGMQIQGHAQSKPMIPKIAQLFPMSFPLYELDKKISKTPAPHGYREFLNPDALDCSLKGARNILLITLGELDHEALSEEVTPNILHYTSHGINFKNHFSGGMNKSDGFFSLLYSLSPNYASSVMNQTTEPVFMKKMRDHKFDFNFFRKGNQTPAMEFFPQEKEIDNDYIESAISDRKEKNLVGPFFTQVYLDTGSLGDKDHQVKIVIDSFIHADLIQNTIVIITGAYSSRGKTPLLILWPGKKASIVDKVTTHYDVIPTIMQEDWKCKTPMNKFSMGKNLLSEELRGSMIRGNYQHFELIDFNNNTQTNIEPPYSLESKDLLSGKIMNTKKNKFILDSLQEMATFYTR